MMMRHLRFHLLSLLALSFLLLLTAGRPSHAFQNDSLSLRPAPDQPLATIGLRHPFGDHPGVPVGASSLPAPCDKDIDETGSVVGVVHIAAQDNGICSNTDIDVYELNGQVYVVQAGGEDAAFTVTRIGAGGTPTLITQKAWAQVNTYTPDVKTFKQGTSRYIALALERLTVGDSACGVVIVDVTNAPTTPIIDQVFATDWCDVHNVFVEEDANGDGRYIYFTADFPNDIRVLDIEDLSNISEIGRYTHPEASNDNYVHDITVVDHGGSIGRRVYVSYWDAGLMILDAADVTPGVVESGSINQPLNPDHSIDPAGFLTHHAYPSEDGTRVFIQDEFLNSPTDEPVQMWDISTPSTPSYVDGIALGSSLMPIVNPAHNLFVGGGQLYVGWYKAGLQVFDFDGSGFTGRPIYHQVQTEAVDNAYDGAWGVRQATVGATSYIFQSDRRYGLIVDATLDTLDSDGDGVIDVSDNCPNWPNPIQTLPPWSVPVGDPDCDGFTTDDENLIGTDPNLACSTDRWPPDFNSDHDVNVFDLDILKPALFSTGPNLPYQLRLDLIPDNDISVFDLDRLKPFFFLGCTP